jgi:hypothetical protein
MIQTEVAMHPDIKNALESKGENWLIAAQVHGSIGYFDPHDAKRNIKHYKRGDRQDFCERCYCLYSGNLENMMLWDIAMFSTFEKSCPESFQRTMQFIEAWSKRPEEPFGGFTGLAFPTMNF